MLEKHKLKKQIKKCKKDIEYVEKKRIRSQSALVQAILTKTTPSDEDVDYFNQYTKQIDDIRRKMAEYEILLEK